MGLIIWLSGLPCAGKTTLGDLLAYELRSQGFKVERLDGDEIRKTISADLGFSMEDRSENLRRVANLARELRDVGNIVICSFISPLIKHRTMIKGTCGDDFFSIFVGCTLKVCIERDVKGMYKKALRGEIKNFTGIHHAYEIDLNMDCRVWTDMWNKEDCIRIILRDLRRKGLL